jgi:hypothetical protein
MGSNRGTKYHAWYGPESEGWQWCAIFISWLMWHVDPALFWFLKTAYSGDFLTIGRRHGREIDIDHMAPGDIVIWDKPIGGITDHIGVCISVGLNIFETVEGNSGDCVRHNTHQRIQTSSCHYYFVRPDYKVPVKKEQEDDEVYTAIPNSPAFVPAWISATQKCYLDFTPQSGPAVVRVSFTRDNGDKCTPEMVKKIAITSETSARFEVGNYWKAIGSGGVTVKVEVLEGSPVLVTRKQTL